MTVNKQGFISLNCYIRSHVPAGDNKYIITNSQTDFYAPFASGMTATAQERRLANAPKALAVSHISRLNEFRRNCNFEPAIRTGFTFIHPQINSHIRK